jgi:hypothetical protein
MRNPTRSPLTQQLANKLDQGLISDDTFLVHLSVESSYNTVWRAYKQGNVSDAKFNSAAGKVSAYYRQQETTLNKK